jgi:hypothetical protein
MMSRATSLLLERLNAGGILFVLIAGGALFLVAPKQAISLAEKRALAPPPHWSMDNALSGELTHQIDAYYADNFIFRDALLSLADRIKAARGVSGSGIEVFDKPDETHDVTALPRGPRGTNLHGTVRSLASPPAPVDERDYADIRSVIVVNGRAVQIATGSNLTAARFASIVNQYHRVFGASVRIYCMAIPVGSDFFLPRAVNHGEMRERQNIEYLYKLLDPGVVPVDAYSQLAQHTGEYILYRTDHHWTALGAYYAYRSFASAAGFTPMPISAMRRRTITNFLGSLYYYTRSQSLRNNPDTVDYYVGAYPTDEWIYDTTNGTPVHGRVFQETAKGGNAYGVFIGGDHPLTEIVSPHAPDRRIIVIKDSYGNAFVPYLAAHYREVWVVDYRYYKGSIVDLARQHEVRELLFAHNTYVLNGRYVVTRALAMLGSRTSKAKVLRTSGSEPESQGEDNHAGSAG